MKTRLGAPLLGMVLLGHFGCENKEKAAARSAGSSVAASASASTAAPQVAVTLRPLPARVGDRMKVVRKASQKLGVEFWSSNERMGTNESSRLEAYARTTEVLGLVGGAAAKLRVTYDRYQHEERRFDRKPSSSPRLAGRTFIVDATDGKVQATSDDGKPLPPEEVDTLRGLHAGLGKDDPVLAALGTRPIAVGKGMPLRDPLFRALVATTSGTLKEGTITLKGTSHEGGREVATFQWTALMTSKEDNGLEITWRFRGEVVAAIAPALTLKSTTEASLDVGGRSRQGGVWVDMQGSGTMQEDQAVTLL